MRTPLCGFAALGGVLVHERDEAWNEDDATDATWFGVCGPRGYVAAA